MINRVFLLTLMLLLQSCASAGEKSEPLKEPQASQQSVKPKKIIDAASLVLSKIEGVYSKIDDIELDFEQTIVQELFDKKTVTRGKIYTIRPGKLFWHTEEPTSKEEKLIISGNEQWLFQPHEKIVYYSKLTPDHFLSKITLLFLRKTEKTEDYFKVQFLGDEKRLALYPKKEIPNIHRIEVLYDKTSYLLTDLNIIYAAQKRTHIKFKNLKTNQDLWQKHKKTPLDSQISQSDFRFNVPPGIKVNVIR